MDRAAPKAAHLLRGDVRARENGRTQPDLATIRGLTRAVKRGAAPGGWVVDNELIDDWQRH
jgi:hypothetical protein